MNLILQLFKKYFLCCFFNNKRTVKRHDMACMFHHSHQDPWVFNEIIFCNGQQCEFPKIVTPTRQSQMSSMTPNSFVCSVLSILI